LERPGHLAAGWGVTHGGGKIVEPEPLLHGADVGAALEQVSSEGMAKGVGADGLRQTGTADSYLDSLVDDAEVNARPPAVEPDESDDPLRRGVLGVHGVVMQTEHLSPLIAECGWWISRRGRHIILSQWYSEIADNRHRAKLLEKQSNMALLEHNSQLINGSASSWRKQAGSAVGLDNHRYIIWNVSCIPGWELV